VVEGLKHLLELQKLDDELLGLEQEQAGLPGRRARMAEEAAAAEAQLAGARQALDAAGARQREAERNLQDREALLRRLEGQQHQVKTNEAYTALLHEMEVARQGISDCETRILESMDAIEAARADVAAAERAQRETHVRLEKEERALGAREPELAHGIQELRVRREAICTHVGAELLSLYARVSSRRRPAVVRISRGICEGCRVDIPPQSFIEILRAERVIACGHCQRILVHRDRLVAPAPG
jgi:predicted  nucleic acid-binding Zn-ribbon protein